MDKERKAYKSPKWIATQKAYFNKDLRYGLNSDTENLLYSVADRTTIRKNYDQMEEAFSCILANLLHADAIDAPIVYSRSSNDYVIERKRYGYGFYTFRMMIRLIDAMYGMGLVQGVKGRKYPTGRCRPSKLWATDELLDPLYSSIDAVFIKPNDEVLYLKDTEKRLIDYDESDLTRAMRNQIHELNEMLGSLDITFTFDYDDLAEKPRARVNKFYKFISTIFSNQVFILPGSIPVSKIVSVREHKRLLTKYYTDFDHDAILSRKFGELSINCAINPVANTLRRVFNVDWCHGGRFYHAPHITLPSACRKTMTINGEPTEELDYSGLHVRMLYNHLGIDYRNECYVYLKSDKANRDDRERMKLASLIVINSGDREKAIKAIHNQCRKKGIHYPAGQFGRYGALIECFQDYHSRIKKFLLSGKGLELQYQDSVIMASILERMMWKGIPALPVHDSIICPARYKEFLRQVMMEEYEKEMGFEPIIDEKGK
ncbi:hypothetical protein DSCW_60410 [Desulfosarcina widdelii]|uniref:Uncharacterized protein n=1 Tax=Desulfosarcina widdelii TaxID=947919 RepID=A0A5K7ZK41_9BACT|nr:hypothetical protein [Desulfosarcina widdelii]BBO78624.1 hypothetical protein DSCW_60410 [Desulfosarcina widdelii]